MCNIEKCNKKHHSRGLCKMHYYRWVKWGDPYFSFGMPIKCYSDNCSKIGKSKGLCDKHYMEEKRKELMIKLGGIKCVKCGTTDFRVLQFDHINGGGRKENDVIGQRQVLFINLKNPNIKKKLQVLCANDNWIKKYELNEVTNRRVV